MPFLLYRIALRVIDGFRKLALENEARMSTPAARPAYASNITVTDYQFAIDRAISELADNTPEARQALYDRARAALASQLSSQDLPK